MIAAATLALVWATGLAGPGATPRAEGQPAAGEPTPQTDASVPARGVIMIGSSPLEAGAPNENETWGIGEDGLQSAPTWHVVRYTSGGGWTVQPGPLSATGQPLSGFEPDHSPLTGDMTASGSGVLVGSALTQPQSETRSKVVLVRNPGGVFQETAVEPEGEPALLKPGESLFKSPRAPLLAALDEGGHAGALVVPVDTGTNGSEEAVLHWNGQEWTRELIEGIPQTAKEEGGFRVLGIGASSPTNAWLLAQLSRGSNAVALFSRHVSSEGASWKPVKTSPSEPAAAPLTVDGEPFTVPGIGEPPTVRAQVLTVTGEGVWIDGERADGAGSEASTGVTVFFKPEGEGADSGEVRATWCNVPAEFAQCTYTLPEALPGDLAASRSFAWADGAEPFGERVITGLKEGVSLRLEGDTFKPVLALGGGEAPEDVGGSLGAAFSDPDEGWLGNELLPVHLTLNPEPNRLGPYPVPFRHALTALAPEPGAPIGAEASEALAVGYQGEVARYVPGQGWLPESLLGAGGLRKTPNLRAVAWPTPTRAYAVGELGQMWLWRGETGLWEPDPATPLNFRGDLLGIAFDPSEPSIGYAVGQQGVLLRYGKTWTQEALPAELQDASFTSVAFAGSEALVAYRLPHVVVQADGVNGSYTGGLLVKRGSEAGWHVDTGAQEALDGAIPWAVAGLPDGGAAISAGGVGGEAPLVLERNGEEASWQPTPQPYPGFEAPSSLALFREGGALRVIGSGGVPNTLPIDTVAPPPAGFPENLIRAYPDATGEGHLLRQTSTGWRDEVHEWNDVGEPPGEYKLYDMVYQPDPIAAVLVNENGDEGWAVGGVIETEKRGALDTADIARYPNNGATPPGIAQAPVKTEPATARFAIGGDSQCEAPCAYRRNAKLGPDAWLSSALTSAAGIEGVRAFFFTGPRVTSGEGHGDFPVPYEREFARYAEVLGSARIPAYAAPSATDRAGGSACPFEQALAPASSGEVTLVTQSEEFKLPGSCSEAAESQPGYYALESRGPAGAVRVIVLEDAGEPDQAQVTWLGEQLREAAAKAGPAIVVGAANLNRQMAEGRPGAQALERTLAGGGSAGGSCASAYFFDEPDRNVTQRLREPCASGQSIPTFGSGTLGYGSASATQEADFTGASGYLLAQVKFPTRPAGNVFPVSVKLIPDIGENELALEAEEGVLLRRSQAALFDALARRPRAGGVSNRGQRQNVGAIYTPISATCIGEDCGEGIFPEYSFTSSDPEVGGFVKQNLAAEPAGREPLLGANEKPIQEPDQLAEAGKQEEGSISPLFCAYRKGKTKVKITAGGYASTLTVTVQEGSVRQPCGTVPAAGLAAPAAPAPAPPAPAPAPAPAGPAPASSPPVALLPAPPAPPAAVTPPPARPVAAALPPFFVLAAPVSPLLPFVPLPVPTPARPTPPSGTSAVTSPVEAPEREEEQEEATESVGNQAVAYSAPEHEPSPVYALGIIVLAAFAGASMRRRPRRGRREVRVAPATISAMRSQRRVSGARGWPR